MGRPSKFTEPVKERILEALRVGASRRTACALAGVDEASLRRWLDKGKKESEGSYHEFLAAVLEAEAHPNARALGIIYREMENRPDLAWKFIERREAGYAPPVAQPAAAAAPVVIQLSFADGTPLALTGTVIDVADDHGEPGPGGTISALPEPTDPAS